VYAHKFGFCIGSIYVNNLLICNKSNRAGEIVKTQLTHHFAMTDMGEPKEIVGWSINKNRIG
jgi:hypothetical protein